MSASSNFKRLRNPQQALRTKKHPRPKKRTGKSGDRYLLDNPPICDGWNNFTLFSFLIFIIKYLPDLLRAVSYWLWRKYERECLSSSASSP